MTTATIHAPDTCRSYFAELGNVPLCQTTCRVLF